MSRRRPGHHECASAQTGASDSPHDEAASDAGEVCTLLKLGTPDPAAHRAGGAGGRSRARALGPGKPSNRQFQEPVNAKALTRYETLLGD